MSIRSRARAASCILFAISLLAGTSAWGDAPSPPDQAPVGQPPSAVSFDGVWEGKLYFDKDAFLAPTSTPKEGATVRLDIHGPVVRVFVQEADGASHESKPGAFHIAPVYANAVIFGTDAAPGGPWVESWVFAITHKDDQTLLVEYARLVNNVGTPLSSPDSKFGTRGYGELKLLPQSATP